MIAVSDDAPYPELRKEMVLIIAAHAMASGDLTGRPVLSDSVMTAMLNVQRHQFVPEEMMENAYDDCPLPIGQGKTISQPFIVALMTDLLDIEKTDRVLEIGTGLGYQAAVLGYLADEVHTVEIIEELAEGARTRMRDLKLDNVHVHLGSGEFGLRQHAPFDKIVVSTSADRIPPKLIEQLDAGGRLIMPVGSDDNQNLELVQKGNTGTYTDKILPVRFSRMIISH